MKDNVIQKNLAGILSNKKEVASYSVHYFKSLSNIKRSLEIVPEEHREAFSGQLAEFIKLEPSNHSLQSLFVDLPSKLGKLKKFSKETIKALLTVKGSKDEDKGGRPKQIVNEENNLPTNKVSDVLKSIYQLHSVTLTLISLVIYLFVHQLNYLLSLWMGCLIVA
jgi:hypothetical protein